MGQIFLHALRHLLDPPPAGGKGAKNQNRQNRPAYNIEFATESGDIVSGNMVCTSSSFKNDTFNFRFTESGEVRTAHATLLMSVNDKEVMV